MYAVVGKAMVICHGNKMFRLNKDGFAMFACPVSDENSPLVNRLCEGSIVYNIIDGSVVKLQKTELCRIEDGSDYISCIRKINRSNRSKVNEYDTVIIGTEYLSEEKKARYLALETAGWFEKCLPLVFNHKAEFNKSLQLVVDSRKDAKFLGMAASKVMETIEEELQKGAIRDTRLAEIWENSVTAGSKKTGNVPEFGPDEMFKIVTAKRPAEIEDVFERIKEYGAAVSKSNPGSTQNEKSGNSNLADLANF